MKLLTKRVIDKPVQSGMFSVLFFFVYLLCFPLQVYSVNKVCPNCQANYNDEDFPDCPLCNTEPDHQEAPSQSLLEHIQNQAIRLFVQAAQLQVNFVLSPDSVFRTLLLIFGASAGETRSELSRYLTGEDDSASEQGAVANLAEEQGATAAGGEGAVYLSANAVVVSSDLGIRESYRDALEQQDNTVLHDGIDFSNTPALKELADKLNKYFCRVTRGMIPSPCSASDWKENQSVSFMNAVYFSGDWEDEFDRTLSLGFTLANGERVHLRDAMKRDIENGRYAYYKFWRAAAIPYQGDYEMVFVLPPNDTMPNEVSPEIIIGLFSSFQTVEKLHVEMPSFSSQSKISLNAPLDQSGLSSLFTPGAANLGGMVASSPSPFSISRITQDCHIRVDRKGTEAAACTRAYATFLSARFYPNEIIFNHPYLYILRHKETGRIIFIGQVYDPQSE
ncbi:serpin family protein [Endozoicomonas euniceicola]|uniref:Serpin family protein n=1 Tax=Endozoicomonas euniceicola TaxID=1234143 RepID=A0ABY6GQW9_9GAMM|nr:serpin family protein [Endozoicomonas euniceicola]UYM15145.1 serpin family protein [Endozoicomonas euniceicola]